MFQQNVNQNSSIRNQFGQMKKLQDQAVKTGGVAIIPDKDRFIYNLITKDKYFNKPTYQTMHSSLEAMRAHIEQNSVKKLAIPRIGCGLDGLAWNKVKDQLEEVFKDVDIEIKVYNFVPPSK